MKGSLFLKTFFVNLSKRTSLDCMHYLLLTVKNHGPRFVGTYFIKIFELLML